MSDPAIIEAACRAASGEDWDIFDEDEKARWRMGAVDVLAAVTPLIRAAALEEAAVVADGDLWPEMVADAIRALKEQP